MDMGNPPSGFWQHFQSGGWAMYPIFALGLLGVAAAGRFAWRGEHQLLGFQRWLTLTVVTCGLFGFFAGMIKVCFFVAYRVPQEQKFAILMAGFGEALSNVTSSLMFTMLTCLLTAVGYRRFPLPNPSAVAR
jgi:hypothetical protein